jgi:hypothetical protein
MVFWDDQDERVIETGWNYVDEFRLKGIFDRALSLRSKAPYLVLS